MSRSGGGAALKVRVASAGTGKTTSLVARYLSLIDSGSSLRRVAGITFTRAAADELRQRVAAGVREVLASGDYLGGLFTPSASSRPRFELAAVELEGALLTTIHGFMVAGLRLNAPQLGLDPNFTMLGEWEASTIFAEEAQSLLLLAQDPHHQLHDAARFLGSEAPQQLLRLFAKRSLAGELSFPAGTAEQALRRLYRAALAAYDQRLGAASLAPGEVERRALRMLESSPARERLRDRYPRVLIDEYQDVNPMQGLFFEQLAALGVKLELVGDPKQSIYAFRNADVAVFRRALEEAERAGTLLKPLDRSRRHARALVVFLNRLTEHLAATGSGFGPSEAGEVTGAGSQAEVPGRVELLIVHGDSRLDELRRSEAALLAARLRELNRSDGVAYDEMAVLARSYHALTQVEAALKSAGVPCLIQQGRGYYERTEVRDVHHALAVGLDPEGSSLAPFLRGPFAALDLSEVAAVLRRPAGERLELIEQRFPAVAERIARLTEFVRLPPLTALEQLLRQPLLSGKRFQELLSRRARENVDALLFEVALHPPRNISLLLERLELLARQPEAGDVPQSGAGVKLLTIHASKGLEFRVGAVFDCGAWPNSRVDPLLVEPASGTVRLLGGDGYRAAADAAKRRNRQESFRLLYVAASRARDHLLLTGSSAYGKAKGWLELLLNLGLEGSSSLQGVSLTRHRHGDDIPYAAQDAATTEDAHISTSPQREEAYKEQMALEGSESVPTSVADYLERRLPAAPLPPLTSPTRLLLAARSSAGPDDDDESAEEPLPFELRASAEAEVAHGRVGWGRARGTLVHYAIGQGWRPDDEATLRTLLAQEVMFPFDQAQRLELVSEVTELLRAYQALLGHELPALAAREVDRAELPLAQRRGEVVWEGIVDRLYRVNGEWLVDDYKTDIRVKPERYYAQLGLYLEALEAALGVRPRGRLVYLRSGQVVEPERTLLEAAVREALSVDRSG